MSGSRLFPDRFTLTITRRDWGAWTIASDAHPGFLHLVHEEQGLVDGLSQVPGLLRRLLIAQLDAGPPGRSGRKPPPDDAA